MPAASTAAAATTRPYKFRVDDIILFLRASRHLRRLGGAAVAAEDICRASFPQIYDEIKDDKSTWPCKAFLVKARLLLDLTMMLMMRHSFAMHRADTTNAVELYMWCDSSPACGFESCLVAAEIFLARTSA